MAIDKKQVQELKKKMQAHADEYNYKLNPDEKPLEGILQGLLRNKEFKGDIYCPCRQVTGNKKIDERIVCPCIYHHGEVELQGKCKCTLFWAK